MNALKAAYEFLRATAFHDIPLPAKMRFRSLPLRDAFGYFYSQPPTIEIDSRVTKPTELLQVMAHEMCHASLEQSAACDHHHHDENFRQLAKIIAERMGWKLKEIV